MTLAFWFWLLWLLGLLLSVWGWRQTPPRVLLWALLFILGLKLFGFPIRG